MEAKFKGELADGHVHVPAYEMIEREIETWQEKQKRILKKMANNPILDQSCRAALWKAYHDVDHGTYWRNKYVRDFWKQPLLREDKKEMTDFYYDYGEYFCDTCGNTILTDDIYCSRCGKMIDWSE